MGTENKDIAVRSESSQVMEAISRAAADPNSDVEKMERLLNLYERVSAKNAEVAFYEAFGRMQTQIPTIDKKGRIIVNNQVRSTYEKNEDLQEVVKPILSAHGFNLSFRVNYDTEKALLKITGVLAHNAGHHIETDFVGAADTSGSKNAIQALASTQSYGQRYTTKALLNIVTRDEDTDGNLPAKPINEDQAIVINDLLAELKLPEARKKAFLKWAKAKTVEDIPAAVYTDAVNHLKEIRDAAD